MTWSVTTAPTGEPITLDAAKAHLYVIGTADNDLITALITAARQHVEAVCERAILSQGWLERQSSFPAVIELRGGLVTAVASVKYVDTDGALQTLAPSAYVVDLTTQPATISPAYDTPWPEVREGLGAVQVAYTVGYPADAVPAALTAAMLLIVGDLYANREASIVGTIRTDNPTVNRLLFPYKRIRP